MDNINRRQALKTLMSMMAVSAIPACTNLAGRNSHCDNYKFDQIDSPVIDMHAHFFNATDLLTVEYLTGPTINDFAGNRFRFTRILLTRIANAIMGLLEFKRKHIKASAELKWLNSKAACSPKSEFETLSKEFFEFIKEEDRNKFTSFSHDPISIPFDELLNLSASELDGGFQTEQKELFVQVDTVTFNELTLFNAVMGNSVYDQKANVMEGFQVLQVCPRDPGFFARIFAFVGRALVRRSTNIQAYYDRYSRQPIDRYGVRHVMNIGCDFDFFLGCRVPTSPIEDQIKVNEKLFSHTNGYAIPVLGVNPWKMYHNDSYGELVDKTLARGIYKGVKLYPSIGYSVTGDFRDGVANRKCNSKGVSKEILQKGMGKLFEIVAHRQAYITSHTTHSKGAEPGAEKLASASYWSEVLRQKPDLRVNFGHMGDPGGKAGPEWRNAFLDLMARFENVYADFGYHDYASYSNLKADLQLFKGEYGDAIFEKITYGSDWYMISKDKGANAYLCDAARNFETAVSENVISDTQFNAMFYGNASRFLRLDPENYAFSTQVNNAPLI